MFSLVSKLKILGIRALQNRKTVCFVPDLLVLDSIALPFHLNPFHRMAVHMLIDCKNNMFSLLFN